jgi:polysaccharide export outer membrane protein
MDENSNLRGAFSTQEKANQNVILITPALIEEMNASHVNNPVYLVGRQDILKVKRWGDVGLINTFAVEATGTGTGVEELIVQNDGTVYYPYAGNVAVAGKSVEQIRILITDKLRKYITEPQVGVSVSKYRSKRVNIMGEVNNPGTYPISDTPMSILDVAMLANINNRTANTEQIYIIRRAKMNNSAMVKPIIYRFDGGSAETMSLAGQFYLNTDDVVFVAPAGVVSWNRVITNILPSLGLSSTLGYKID